MFRTFFTTALAALFFVTVTAASPANALDLSSMTDEERAAFQTEVRAYLLEHPEVIMEAVAVLEQRQAEQQSAADENLVRVNSDALFNDGYSFVGGNPNGDITIVEFADYRCGYCRRAHPELNELLASDGNIRLIVKEFPILGEQSVLASRFAISTLQLAGPEKYAVVNDVLMTFRGDVSVDSLGRIAAELGLDFEAISARMNSDEVSKVISDTYALGQRMQISGTPTFILEDELLRGYLPLEAMRELVAAARKG